jgi:hypothetical protein
MKYFSIVAFNRLLFAGIVVAMLFSSCKKESSTVPIPVKSSYAWDKFSMGADLSYATQMANSGYTFHDSGKVKETCRMPHKWLTMVTPFAIQEK